MSESATAKLAASHMESVAVRPGRPGDLSFLYASWLTSHWNHSSFTRRIGKEVYYRHHHRAIERLLGRGAKVLVACPSEDPDTILGWLCTEDGPAGPLLHYCYIRLHWRRLGIAAKLVHAAGIDLEGSSPIACTHIAADIAPRPPFEETNPHPTRSPERLRHPWFLDKYRTLTYCPYYL